MQVERMFHARDHRMKGVSCFILEVAAALAALLLLTRRSSDRKHDEEWRADHFPDHVTPLDRFIEKPDDLADVPHEPKSRKRTLH